MDTARKNQEWLWEHRSTYSEEYRYTLTTYAHTSYTSYIGDCILFNEVIKGNKFMNAMQLISHVTRIWSYVRTNHIHTYYMQSVALMTNMTPQVRGVGDRDHCIVGN